MVSKRGSSWQASFYWQGERLRKSFPTQAEALRWEADTRERLTKGQSLESIGVGTRMTLRQLADLTEARFWKGTRNGERAAANADEVLARLGEHRDPASVTAVDIDQLVQWLRDDRKNSGGTINRKLAALSKILKYGQDRGLIDRVPKLERMKESQHRLRWYTPEEEARVLKHLVTTGQQDFADLVVFLADTGARLSEACGIEWRDIDTVYARFFRTKSGKSRAVPLTSRLRDVLKRRFEAAPTQAAVFPEWDRISAWKRWDAARKACGLTDAEANLHAWRHTYASRLVQNGVSIAVVQQLLGHATLSMTMRYAHLAPSNTLQAVAALEKAVSTERDCIPVPDAV